MHDPVGDVMFTIVPIFIGVIFVIVFGFIFFTIVQSFAQRQKNNQSPKLQVKAKVTSKRTDILGGGETRARNLYYVTFEVQSGDRMEMALKGEEYGQLTEGDEGELHFQGTRYLGFTRFLQTDQNESI